MAMKVLGQDTPTLDTDTTLYTVPSAKSTVVSSLVVCNTNSTATTFRVAIRVAGASIVTKHYLYYDVTLAGNDTFVATIGITLATTDVVTIRSSSSNVAFNLFGDES